MKNDALHTLPETDDDSLKLKYQDKEYNASYKQWRRENKDSMGFFYVETPNRITYQDSVGFINDYPEVQEEISMRRVINVLGLILLFKSFFDVFSIYFLPHLLNLAGVNIRYDFFAGKLYGSDTVILTVKFISSIVSLALPIGLLAKRLHMPLRIMLPLKINNRPMFAASVPIMLLICGVCSAMSTVYEQILGALRISTERSMLIPEKPSDMVYLIITQMILVPAASELCSRGVLLQVTRQFGDGSALLITGFVTAALYYDITGICFAFIAAVTIGYFTIRTGSVITAIVMRITMQFFIYVMYYLDYKQDNELVVMLFLFAAIMTGIVFTSIFLYKHSDIFGIDLLSRYMTYDKKILAFLTSSPIIIWLTIVFIVSIFNIKFI